MNVNDLRPASEFAKIYGCKCLVYGAAGSGKCLALGTKILMYDGSIKNVEDIKINDLLMGPDSTPRKVLSLAHGFDNMFDIIPNKGNKHTVNSVHVLSLKSTLGKNTWISNIPLNEYLKSSKNFKNTFKLWRANIDFNYQYVSIDPYLLGYWLGDGSSEELAFHTKDKEVVDYLNQVVGWFDLKVKFYQKNEKRCPRYRLNNEINRGKVNKLKELFKNYNLFNNKHIPKEYLINNRQIRLQVLAGLLDSDGYLGSNTFDYISKIKQLSEQICFLARSLGLAAYMVECKKKDQHGAEGTYYRVSISGHTNLIPTKIKRKQATIRRQKKNVTRTGFKVKPIGYGEYYGFTLTGDGLFVLDDFTVTHNTPLLNTAPRPLLLATEPGLLSMRGSKVPTYQAFEPKAIDEFFEWFFKSKEVEQFDTFGLDSGSEMAGIYLVSALKANKHGMKAYGEMAEAVEKHMRKLYFMPNKHIYFICKQEIIRESNYKRPYFPGQYLPVQAPHLFDFVLNLGIHSVPGMGQIKAFQCNESFDTMARSRTGNLNTYEPPDLTQLFKKAMS